MRRGVRKREGENLSPANIRRVIHSLNEEGITKKVACEMLNISYNTTRLNRIIEEFEEQENYVAIRKLQTKGKPASPDEIKQVIQDYVEGKKLNKRLKDITYYRLISLQHVAFKMQDVFKKDNPDFDCESFFNDCNVGSQITRQFI